MGTAKEQDYLSGSSLPHSSPVLADLIFWYNQPQRSGIFKFFLPSDARNGCSKMMWVFVPVNFKFRFSFMNLSAHLVQSGRLQISGNSIGSADLGFATIARFPAGAGRCRHLLI